MDNLALQTIAQQLQQKKSQTEARLGILQKEVNFYDYLLHQVNFLVSTDSNIPDPSSYLRREITKARTFYRMPNQNQLADNLNEGFNLPIIFPLTENQEILSPTVNLAVAASQPSSHQMDNERVNEVHHEVHHEEENNEIVNLGPDEQVTVDDHENVDEESSKVLTVKDIEIIDLVSDEEEKINEQDGNQVEEEVGTIPIASTSNEPKRSSTGNVNYVNSGKSTEEGHPCKRRRTCSSTPTVNQQSSISPEAATNLPASFSAMPPEILDIILNKSGIPLHEQISLRIVSSLFRDVIEEGLHQKSTLSLIVDNSYKKHNIKPKANDWIIRIARFNTMKCIQFLGRLFPRVIKLILYSDSLVAWRQAPELIRLYATQLDTLKVDGYPLQCKNDEAIFKALGDSVNSISTLKSLDFRVNCKTVRPAHLNIGNLLRPHLGATLSRLNRFICLANRMEKYASFIATSFPPRCTQLRLIIKSFDRFKDRFKGPFLTKLVSNLTHLHLIHCSHTFLSSLSQLSRLSSLTLFFDHSGLNFFQSSLLQELRPLSRLTKLRLLNIDYRRPLGSPPANTFTFPNVKQLTLQLSVSSALPNGAPSVPRLLQTLSLWFSNLSRLSLYIDERFAEEIESIQPNIPYTVTHCKEKLPSKYTFW